MKEGENKPLLDTGSSDSEKDTNNKREDGSDLSIAMEETEEKPAAGLDELPPAYITVSAGVPMVRCRVCSNMIDISIKKDQQVVKCNFCNEATPIRNALPGRKYVRCPCNCLLICKINSERIACPRPNCKRIMTLEPSEKKLSPLLGSAGMVRVTCAHCHDMFLFNTNNKSLARCPHCRKVSSVGTGFARKRSLLFLILGLVVIGVASGVTAGTVPLATDKNWMYAVYSGAFLVGAILLIRSIYYCAMKTSVIDGPI